MTGQELNYEAYTSLLTSATSNYDAQFKIKPKSYYNLKHMIYSHDFSDTDVLEQNPSEDIENYSIDMPIQQIEVNLVKKTPIPRESILPYKKWALLNWQDHEAWDHISNKGKAVIVKTMPSFPQPPVDKIASDSRIKHVFDRHSNLHQFIPYEYMPTNQYNLYPGGDGGFL